MVQLNLKRLIQKEWSSILESVIHIAETTLSIHDIEGNLLLGDPISDAETTQYPIKVAGRGLGWVKGGEKASAVASLLSFLATQEVEKKALVHETLERYKEITLLYNVSEKLAASLGLKAVADLVLDEASKLIDGDSGSVLLLNSKTHQLETASAYGQETISASEIVLGKGIIGDILLTGNGEIINDVLIDPRLVSCEAQFSSLICAPLKLQSHVIGAIVLGSINPVVYTGADLKLFSALTSQAAAAIENAQLHENKLQEERIKSNLERYVSAQVVQAIMESQGNISLEPMRQDVVVLFSDIRNFTAQCEELPPEKIVGHLNEYFTHMVEVIFSRKGTVNKFVGDMIVALFGAPFQLLDSEKRAVEAAIAMQKRIKVIPNAWIQEHFNTGIGISSGRVIVGNVGSPQHMDYTAIGDDVNIASRLQSLALGGQILVSRSIYDATKDYFQFKEMGEMNLKGKKNAIEIFEVIY